MLKMDQFMILIPIIKIMLQCMVEYITSTRLQAPSNQPSLSTITQDMVESCTLWTRAI